MYIKKAIRKIFNDIDKLHVETGDMLLLQHPSDEIMSDPNFFTLAMRLKKQLHDVGKDIVMVFSVGDVTITNVPAQALIEQGYIRRQDALDWFNDYREDYLAGNRNYVSFNERFPDYAALGAGATTESQNTEGRDSACDEGGCDACRPS